MSDSPVIIAGAGWAGLAAAVTLTSQGKRVIVYESARQAGGRARSVPFNDWQVDNGQHIMIGAYTECIRLLKMVGQCPYAKFKRMPLQLSVQNRQGKKIILEAPRLPAPLHLLYALLRAQGLSFKDRLSGIYFGLYLKRHHYHFTTDISVQTLFARTRQSENIIRNLWEPLCLATLNTPVKLASANLFMHVFEKAFTRHYYDADLLLPITDLSNTFPDAAVQYIRSKGGEVHFQSRLEEIHGDNQQLSAITIKQQDRAERISCQNLVVAVPPQQLEKLLRPHPLLDKITANIQHLHYQPIVTAYLQYPAKTRLTTAMQGLSGTIGQWVFDRGLLCKQEGLLAVVISGEGPHMQMDNDSLLKALHAEVIKLFRQPPELLDALVIREKRATFSSKVNIASHRVANSTAMKGLYLAGDYTATGYPATLEGAVLSGVTAAKLLSK